MGIVKQGSAAWVQRQLAKQIKRKGGKGDRAEVVKFGEALNFRGFLHAPSNEMGVVSLFGAMALDLGYQIEAFRQRYPDCEAKRLIDPATGTWWKCRIEFEFRSSNFLKHGHDPDGCDLIVCWEHDWLIPKVNVLELRRAVDAVRAGGLPGGKLLRGPRMGMWAAAGRVDKE